VESNIVIVIVAVAVVMSPIVVVVVVVVVVVSVVVVAVVVVFRSPFVVVVEAVCSEPLGVLLCCGCYCCSCDAVVVFVFQRSTNSDIRFQQQSLFSASCVTAQVASRARLILQGHHGCR